eukprot:CAMPEP_0177631582 /NCGR_PEP_ID=MMETSP0447-20121125/1828_1 /TAXON_ID=0 /ORGANISM="Stygamoeba regulata, Strain BSH-02190019" /LENGTH=420 /DNA_ID=CAMNT_0019133079 /DNA_START=241 /DNA_END=1503 /DNA_ORIENTATION=+
MTSSLLPGMASTRAASKRPGPAPASGRDAVIVTARRTPILPIGGAYKHMTASDLGALVIKDVANTAGIAHAEIQEVYMGNVLQAGQGQAPARQALVKAGLPFTVPATTVNKVCASGMKALQMASQAIMLGHRSCMVAGGMESMSQVPHYLMDLRKGLPYGHSQAVDGVINDGLWDAYNDIHMGQIGEHCAREMGFSREEQDDYAIESYKRAQAAINENMLLDEVCVVAIPERKGEPTIVRDDANPFRVKFDKVRKIPTVFDPSPNGTITAANASSVDDGAAALLLMSAQKAEESAVKPMARVIGMADTAVEPINFPIAPVSAVRAALDMAKLSVKDIDFWEINEAFSVVMLANMKLLELDHARVNVFGGAVSMGHPIGCSGARIVGTLAHVLQKKDAKYGVAAICNGGGGASAVVIERLN